MTHIIELADDFDGRTLAQQTSSVDIQRVVKLITEALTRSTNPRQYGWCVIGYPKLVDGKWNYLVPPIYDGYFLRQDKNLWIVGDSERGHDYPIAIFPGNLHEAAKYFVWKVSKGVADIDWSLYLWKSRVRSPISHSESTHRITVLDQVSHFPFPIFKY